MTQEMQYLAKLACVRVQLEADGQGALGGRQRVLKISELCQNGTDLHERRGDPGVIVPPDACDSMAQRALVRFQSPAQVPTRVAEQNAQLEQGALDLLVVLGSAFADQERVSLLVERQRRGCGHPGVKPMISRPAVSERRVREGPDMFFAQLVPDSVKTAFE
jgi:hypothetical protein